MRSTGPGKRWLGRLIVSSLLCLGFWQFGQGAYIPAKAWVAQELMNRAWRKADGGAAQPASLLSSDKGFGQRPRPRSEPADPPDKQQGVASLAHVDAFD